MRSAAHANAMAERLRSALEAGIAAGTYVGWPSRKHQANAIFATCRRTSPDRIREQARFLRWDRARGEVRWMTAWDTTVDDVDRFVAIIATELSR